jgi:hypothetical protein
LSASRVDRTPARQIQHAYDPQNRFILWQRDTSHSFTQIGLSPTNNENGDGYRSGAECGSPKELRLRHRSPAISFAFSAQMYSIKSVSGSNTCGCS